MVTEILILVKVQNISKKVVKLCKKYKNTPYSKEYWLCSPRHLQSQPGHNWHLQKKGRRGRGHSGGWKCRGPLGQPRMHAGRHYHGEHPSQGSALWCHKQGITYELNCFIFLSIQSNSSKAFTKRSLIIHEYTYKTYLSQPWWVMAYLAAMATLLYKQKPCGWSCSAWWPGGRITPIPLKLLLLHTSSMTWNHKA